MRQGGPGCAGETDTVPSDRSDTLPRMAAVTSDREPLSRVVQLRLSDSTYSALHVEAGEQSVSHSDVLRAAIVSYLHRAQPDLVDEDELERALEAAGWQAGEGQS